MNLYFATFFVGVNTAAAKSFLGAASSVGDSLTADSSSSSQAQGARAAQLRVLETWLVFICSRANGNGYQVGWYPCQLGRDGVFFLGDFEAKGGEDRRCNF